MYAIKIDCKITQFFPRARADIRERCVKIDTPIGWSDLRVYKLTYYV